MREWETESGRISRHRFIRMSNGPGVGCLRLTKEVKPCKLRSLPIRGIRASCGNETATLDAYQAQRPVACKSVDMVHTWVITETNTENLQSPNRSEEALQLHGQPIQRYAQPRSDGTRCRCPAATTRPGQDIVCLVSRDDWRPHH